MDAIVSAVPVWGLVALGVLAVLQIALDVFALVDLYRRPIDQVVFANKWIWLAIVLLVSTVGAIIYLVVARKPAIGPDDAPPPLRNQLAPTPSPILSTGRAMAPTNQQIMMLDHVKRPPAGAGLRSDP
jgi:hypothetical protein